MTSITFAATSDDCYSPVAGPLVTGSTTLSVAGVNTPSDANVRTWIPFVVYLPKMTIISATLRWTATDTRTETFNYWLRCEAADSASVPANTAALYAKSVTTGTNPTTTSVTAGVEYSHDVTAAVQAVLSRAGWASGGTLAIIVDDDTATGSQRREYAASENATYSEAQLDIVYASFIPQGMLV